MLPKLFCNSVKSLNPLKNNINPTGLELGFGFLTPSAEHEPRGPDWPGETTPFLGMKGGVFKKHRTMPVLTLKILLTRED
jgi:hypothetical protein